MLDDVLDALTCPVCQPDERTFQHTGSSLICERRHTFDIARQGYVNLLTGRPPTGDTTEMVQARAAFLDQGFFAPLREQVGESVAKHSPTMVVEAGAGTGYYLASALDRCSAVGLAMDTSKHALRRAARCHPQAGAILADVWGRLPLKSGVADVVMCVFAPRNGAEFARILRPDGTVVVATPTERHLTELVDVIGALSVDSLKQERLTAALDAEFRLDQADLCEFPLQLGLDAAEQVVAMGPSAYHLDRTELRSRVTELGDPVDVTASVQISTWRRVSSRR